ncbi:hypothetical protein GPECTOR_85g333 [Gonium pectorale]|uniref:Aminotransferase class V domain-containing protein n=1 Tax=Gonium pectorale TaxID=33097 RepID=A0A150G145_GONPE|nr:hypothetical protein GPECTOR_85g333 [Gonium pectorale]|eukprot:KXZ43603.1 hypothetical protein GPECTOR_85g333 [Gonium pectorale]
MASSTATPAPAAAPIVARTGYQNFGSFFTDNVEDMIAVPSESYVPPGRPFVPPSLEGAASLGFGEPCRQLFMVDFNRWKFINHGAFGGVCNAAHQEANQWREHCEAQPLLFLDRRVPELFPQMVRVMREVADFIGSDPRDLVFVPNATTGLNVAIQAAGLRPGDTMYMLNIGYGSVKKMAQAASAAAAGRGAGTDPAAGSGGEAPGGINVVYGEVTFPISGPQDIVDLVARTLPPDTRLAVFDSVTSNTALRLPLRQLTALCKSRGVQVLIDGAHALGHCHLDLRRGRCGGCDDGAAEDVDETSEQQHQRVVEEGGIAADDAAAEGSPRGGAKASGADSGVDFDAASSTRSDAKVGGAGAGAGLQQADNTGATAAAESTTHCTAGIAASTAATVDDALCVPDYFVTNCHKWLCAPRGSALLWVSPARKAAVRPLVVSHGSGCGFTSDFIWDGCRDYAPYLATSSALALWRALRPARVRRYMRSLLVEAVTLLAGRWGTGPLAPSFDMCGAMALVELPQDLAESSPATSTDAKYIQARGVHTRVFCVHM